MSHCQDCCCARSWEALGIDTYTGKSIAEHIQELKAQRDAAVAALQSGVACLDQPVLHSGIDAGAASILRADVKAALTHVRAGIAKATTAAEQRLGSAS